MKKRRFSRKELENRRSERSIPMQPPPNRPNLMTNEILRASVATASDMLSRVCRTAYGKTLDYDTGPLTKRDIAILRFFGAIELIESDLWQQYDELGGVTVGSQNPYQLALQFLDDDGSQNITGNTIDEISHSTYLNAYLESEGADPVDFDRFRTLRGSWSTMAQKIGRLTNLKHLDIDTTWYARYRQGEDPGFKWSSLKAIRIVNRQAIPRSDADFEAPSHVQAIANTAAFHFGYIEYLVSSLYATFSHKLKRAKVLKVALGIGGNEIAHFLEWVDFASNAVQWPPFQSHDLPSPMDGYEDPLSVTNAKVVAPFDRQSINFPIPPDVTSEFLNDCAALLPLEMRFGGAVNTVNNFSQNGLFVGQSPEFLRTLLQMAEEADSALGN
jgi:hypothetical protein